MNPLIQFSTRCIGQIATRPREQLLARMPRNSVCAEIGVHEGTFSNEILRFVKPARLHLIDPWEYLPQYEKAWYGGKATEGQATLDGRFHLVQSRFRKQIARGKVVLHRKYSSDAINEFSDGYFDWIYIDANHLYEYVRSDLELYAPKVKAGGFITGDDYGITGWWSNGVQKAVDEYVGQIGASFELIGSQFIITSTDHKGRQFRVVAAEREDGGRFIVRADEKLTAFVELEKAIHREVTTSRNS